MTTNIYDLHSAAFNRVSAYVVTKDGKRIASIAFKFPADGAGRLFCYAHVFGMPMVRGYANGYGYDKKSAACEAAVAKIVAPSGPEYADDAGHAAAIKAALSGNDGYDWDRRIRDAGYDVWQAV